MYSHETQIRVRYAETDQMGYVYYGNYSTYYEVARVEALRNLGLSYKSLEETGTIMPVTENYSKFIRPGKYDDLLTINVLVKDLPKKRVDFFYEIYNQNQKLIHEGRTQLAFVDVKEGRSTECPDDILTALKPYFNE